MPNLPLHIYLAHQVAERLDWGYLHDNIGSCFLGSTAPDIRAMTRRPREQTHFAPLDLEVIGTGARTMFHRHPELAVRDGQTALTRAFLVGYVSHLAADELWITTMFRPHFDGHEPVTGSEVESHIWDRALQLEMDRKARLAMDSFGSASQAIASTSPPVEVGFLEEQALQEWQDWVERFLGWDFTWDRLKRALNRMYRDNDSVQQLVDRFLQEMPHSLERVFQHIPPEKLDAYLEQAVAETLSQVREHLGD